jgi:hypothetical protein
MFLFLPLSPQFPIPIFYPSLSSDLSLLVFVAKKTLGPGGFAEKWEVGEEIRGDTALPPV